MQLIPLEALSITRMESPSTLVASMLTLGNQAEPLYPRLHFPHMRTPMAWLMQSISYLIMGESPLTPPWVIRLMAIRLPAPEKTRPQLSVKANTQPINLTFMLEGVVHT